MFRRKKQDNKTYGVTTTSEATHTTKKAGAVGGHVKVKATTPKKLVNTDLNAREASVKEQEKLEKALSVPAKGVQARVVISTGDYVKVKFFRNNKPFATYKSRAFDVKDAKAFVKKHTKDL